VKRQLLLIVTKILFCSEILYIYQTYRKGVSRLKKVRYYLLKILSFVFCLMPYSLLLVIGKQLGKLYYHFATRQCKRAFDQIQYGMNLSPIKAKRIIRSLCCKLGQTFAEILYSPRLNPINIKKIVKIENKQYLTNALQEGHGVVIWTAHMGNWEWLAAGLAMNGFSVTTIYKQQPGLDYTQLLNEFRARVGVEVFASRSSTELIKAARAIKQGKILGFLADKDAGENGIFINFFHKPASTPLGPAIFAKKFHSPIIPAFIVRRPGGHRIILQQPLYYEDTGNKDKDIYNLTAKLNKITENIITDYPDEWLWFKKRWNTKPENYTLNV